MIAKIAHGSRIYGALLYNHQKVLQNSGDILHLNNMLESPDGKYTAAQLLASFLPYLAANKKTEKTAVHISMNPDPNDFVSDEDFITIATEYMDRLGYGEQPYVVFKHHDIDRTHIHIVSTCVNKNGVKIADSFEKKRSMDICREIEKKFNLTPATEKLRSDENTIFSPLDHTKGNIKSQIAAIVRYLPKYYNFQSLGSYNALLSLFNISVESIKKEYNGEIKEGLIYFALDHNGLKVSNPFKASLFGKQAGLTTLRSHFEISKKVSPELKAKTSQIITEALNMTANERDFKDFLIEHGINSIIRRNEQGRLYGITFIDHNTRNVFNGSHLGKQFSANVFHDFFSKAISLQTVKNTDFTQKNNKANASISNKNELHPLFEFMVNSGAASNDWGILDELLLNGMTEDPEEQLFEFNMKKKKRKNGQHKR